ncbi:terpene synthase family protein [Burkholderia mayonis]|nr:terpene synthase [Burkholderia mayonis]
MVLPMSQIAPSILCPFPLKELQPVDDYVDRTASWLIQQGLVDSDGHARALAGVGAHYMKCCYPDIQPDQMQDFSDFAAWNCLLDDFVEKGPLSADLPRLTHFLKSIGYLCEASNYIRPSDFGFDGGYRIAESLIDVKVRINAWTSPAQIDRLMRATSHFMSGLAWEAAFTKIGDAPDLNVYCAIRTANVGMHMANALAECVNDVAMTPAERASPAIQVLTQCILFVLVIDNDIYSHHKEKNDGAAYPSIIDVLARSHDDRDPDAARSDALDLRNQCLLCYLALKKKCQQSVGLRLDRYFKGLEDIISGNLVFGSTCPRYTAPGSPQFLGNTNVRHVRSDSIQIEVVDTLDCPISPPRHIPSIGWWWSLLE